jgi:hypothetical protein
VNKLLQNVLPHYAPVSYSLLTANFIFSGHLLRGRDQSPQDLARFDEGHAAAL